MGPLPPTLTNEHALFLDFDGTLVGFAKIPNAVTVSPELKSLVGQVHESLGEALAIVTGREIAFITEQFAPLVLPVAGSHGAERRRPDGEIEVPGEEISREATRLAERFDSELGDIPNMHIEHKVFSVALHYRNAPDYADRVAASAEKALGEMPDWVGVPGKMVIEIRPAAFSKGSAVEAFMAESPFSGRIPVFVGDDTTDEDGMKAAEAHGGFGIKVGEGESVARYRLADPQAVHDWLKHIVG